MSSFGFVRVNVCVPQLTLSNVSENYAQHKRLIEENIHTGSQIFLFPELSLTGYTCNELFHESHLLNEVLLALIHFQEVSSQYPDILIIIGAPIIFNSSLYNCAAVYNSGKLIALIPKTFLPNYDEFKEKIYFQSCPKETQNIHIQGIEHLIPFGREILFQSSTTQYCTIAIEICEDLWAVEPPSNKHALYGANIICNLSASNELVGKADYRRRLVRQQSERCIAGYCYVSSGIRESTTDMVFGGHGLVYENGQLLGELERFQQHSVTLTADLDVEYLALGRIRNTVWGDSIAFNTDIKKYKILTFYSKSLDLTKQPLLRPISQYPFVPSTSDEKILYDRCQEIVNIQAHGLAMRFEHINAKKLILGVSGGLDSTYALLVCKETCNILKLPLNTIVPLTMPGYGTSNQTRNIIISLCKTLQLHLEIISIVDAVDLHLKALNHNGQHDITYENAQARERTQILFDKANQLQGLVVGTSDLSELALGWTTYNGDHMSSYGLNSSIPKTLVRVLIKWYAENKIRDAESRKLLFDIIEIPISPELLPPSVSGKIQQKTEENIGPFDLHDFFLFYFVRRRFSPQKILYLAENAFKGKYSRIDIKNWLILFLKRFFANQFKRDCLPDGPKVGSVSLSPRGEWRMPSDADIKMWIEQLGNDN